MSIYIYISKADPAFLEKGGGPKSKGEDLSEGRRHEGGMVRNGVVPSSVHVRKKKKCP